MPKIKGQNHRSNEKKKIAQWVFGALLLIGILFIPLLSFAKDDPDKDCIDFTQNSLSSSATFFQKISENILGKVSDTDLSDVFQIGTRQGKAPGEDLYLLIHEQFKNRPYSESVRLTAERFNYPEGDVDRVLSGAVSPLMLDSGRQLTVPEATERLAKFHDSFQEEFARQNDILEVEMDLVPIEIFANDDVSDSGFDLITDLDKIEDILFGLSTVDRMNFAYANTTSSLDDFGNGNDDNGSSGDSGSDSNDAGVKRDDGSSGGSASSATEGVSRSPESDSKTCSASSDLTDIVNSALSAGDESAEDSAQDGSENPDEKVSRYASSSEPTDSSPTGYKNSDGADINLSKPSNWTGKIGFCKDFFCLDISMENTARTIFPDDENCVACHVGTINDNLNKTLLQNLLPSKVTGNLFEAPTCKKAAADQMPPSFLKESPGGLITITKKPISTPIDDDIVTKIDFKKSWKEILENPAISTLSMNESSLLFSDTQRYFAFCDENMTAEEKETSGCTKSLADTLTNLVLTNAPEGSTYQDTMSEIESLQDQQVRSAQKQAQNSRSTARTKIKSEFYQYLKPEIDQMQSYFNTFFSLLKEIQEGSAKNLAEKQEVK